jgi:NADPH:quinone reductase-like Zn-dependent oxidoreductase
MKAILYYNYGSPDVLKYEDIEKPAPGDNEVLIKVLAASVNPLDWRLMRGTPRIIRILARRRRPAIREPMRPGVDVAGLIEAVGKNVTRFKPGDAVFGCCKGALAEYACASESALVVKPDNVTFEQAASVPVAALTALQGLRGKGHIQPGQKVLINGAAGGVGTFAVQIAKWFGADVTGVCSTKNVDMVRSIGADRVIDYTGEDFTRSGQRYDLLLDNVGNLSLSACRRVLSPNGRCIIAGAPKNVAIFFARAIAGLALSRFVRQKFVVFIAKINQEDLTFLGELMASGKLTPVIDGRYRLSESPQAIRYLEEGHARGKVVITVEDTNKA